METLTIAPTSSAIQSSPPRAPVARPGWLPPNVWPFETVRLDFEGGMIAVTDVGQGPALLFVHTGTWSFIWRDVMARLAKQFRCVCFDAPGTGLSAPLPGSTISLKLASRAVGDVIERLELREFTLVAHDLGGIAGLSAASRVPDRLCGIAAINTFGWTPSGAVFRGMLALMGSSVMRELDVLTGYLPRIGSSAFGAGRLLDDEGRRAYASALRGDRVRAFHHYMRAARHSEDLYDEVERALAGPFRGLPLLTIFGEHNDPLGFQLRWKKAFPGAVQVVVSGGNHYPMCDDPDLVARSLRAWHGDRIAPNLRTT